MTAVISYRNWADLATLSSNFGVQADYPLDNLKKRQLAVDWRSTSVGTGVQITADLGVNRMVRLVGLFGVPTEPMDPTPSAPPSPVNFTVARSDNGSTWTTVSTVSVLDFMWPGAGPHGLHFIPGGLVHRYWRITTSFNPLPPLTVRAGRLWIADALEIPGGVDAGWTLGLEDTGRVDESAGLQAYEDRRARRRRLRLDLKVKDAASVFGFAEGATIALDVPSLQAAQLALGGTGEVVVLPRTATAGSGLRLWPRRLGVYGRLARPIEIRHTEGPYYSATLDVLEEL